MEKSLGGKLSYEIITTVNFLITVWKQELRADEFRLNWALATLIKGEFLPCQQLIMAEEILCFVAV